MKSFECSLALGAALISTSCTRQPTQLVVVVDTDLPGAREVHVTAAEIGSERLPSEHSFTIGSGRPGLVSLPFSFGVAPSGGNASARVELVIDARAEAGAPIVRRVRTGFIAGRILELRVFLPFACRDVSCPEDQTCGNEGVCVDVEVSPESLPQGVPGTEVIPRDAGSVMSDTPGIDASRPDAGSTSCDVATSFGSPRASDDVVLDFSMAGSPDGGSLARVEVTSVPGTRNTVLAFTTGATSLMSGGFFGVQGGPVAISYSRDGRVVAFAMVQGVTPRLYPVSAGATRTDFPNGCSSVRCLAPLGDGSLAFLGGSTNLALGSATAAGAGFTLSTPTPVASGVSGGGVRAAPTGVYVVYVQGTSCMVEHWATPAERRSRRALEGCVAVDVAALAGGRAGVAWRDPMHRVHASILPEEPEGATIDLELDTTQAASQPVFATPTRRGYRVTWVDDTTSEVRSAHLAPDGVVLEHNCVFEPTHSLNSYRRMRVDRVGNQSRVEWFEGYAFFGTQWSD